MAPHYLTVPNVKPLLQTPLSQSLPHISQTPFVTPSPLPGMPSLFHLSDSAPSSKAWLQDAFLWEALSDCPIPLYTLLQTPATITVFPLAPSHVLLHIINHYLLNAYCVPTTVLDALNAELVILTIHSWVVGIIYSHYTDEEMERGVEAERLSNWLKVAQLVELVEGRTGI